MIQSRWQSPVFWSTLITSIVGLLSAMGFWTWIGVTEAYAVNVAGAVIALVSAVIGNVNNPTNPAGWGANTIDGK